jgi:hypothetical protein
MQLYVVYKSMLIHVNSYVTYTFVLIHINSH